jgi:hypothetical protein
VTLVGPQAVLFCLPDRMVSPEQAQEREYEREYEREQEPGQEREQTHLAGSAPEVFKAQMVIKY